MNSRSFNTIKIDSMMTKDAQIMILSDEKG
jgi:hypothetical protein